MEELMPNITVFVVRVWGGQHRGTDTECYCVCCEVLGMAIYRQKLIQNFPVLLVRFCGNEYREELIPNITVFL
jgi:hypothetical protein